MDLIWNLNMGKCRFPMDSTGFRIPITSEQPHTTYRLYLEFIFKTLSAISQSTDKTPIYEKADCYFNDATTCSDKGSDR